MENPIFAKDSILKRIAKLEERCQQYEQEMQDEFLIACREKLGKLKTVTERSDWFSSEDTWCTVIKDYIRGLLDVTFYEENELADAEFEGQERTEKLQDIIEHLTDAENLCIKSPKGSVIDAVGIEYAECLLWRKGALLYMFCHVKQNNKTWIHVNKELYIQFLKQGINELNTMLSTRQSDDEEIAEQNCDEDTIQLIEKGIFSDTHMLAMMYLGEMCYWLVKVCPEQSSKSQTAQSSGNDSEELNPVSIGKKFLQKYIDACNIVKLGGWDTNKAKELLDFFIAFID